MKQQLCPSEEYEGELFASWLSDQGYLFSHLAQNTFTRSFATKAKLKRAGVKPGVPDYLICLKNQRLMFVELKRIKGGQVSVEQKEWLSNISACGCLAIVAKGFEAAREAVLKAEEGT